MKLTRDLTAAQFERRLREHGIGPRGPLGYRCVGGGAEVCEFNPGRKSRRRTRLAYLLAEQRRLKARGK